MLILLTSGSILYNSLGRIWYRDINWLSVFGVNSARQFLFPVISVIFFIILFSYNIVVLLEKRGNSVSNNFLLYKIIYLILSIFFILRFTAFDNNNLIRNSQASSDWKIYSKFYNNESYLIPIEPENWYMIKNIKIHYFGYNEVLINLFSIHYKEISSITRFEKETQKINEIFLEKPLNISYLYTKRPRENNFNKLKLIGYDDKNQPVIELEQLNAKDRLNIGFKNYNIKEISVIRFFDEKMNPAYVYPDVLIGEEIEK